MRLRHLCIALLVVQTLYDSVAGIRWLSLAMLSANQVLKEESCDTTKGLVKKQRQICRRYVDIMDAVQEGAIRAIRECQHQFRNRRWNCSTVNAASIFGNAISLGTRESAFVHALSAAGVAHAVTRACSSGSVSRCGCDRSVRGRSPQGFEWAGCSDNIAFGNAFCRSFVDVRERARGGKAGRALMNLHNNNAGRQVIEDHMNVQCKCHGVSGSCEMKTCWRALPSFNDVGSWLKEKFDGATEVYARKVGSRRRLVPTRKRFKPHTGRELVYLTASPDFCEIDMRAGSLGTRDRRCNRTSKGTDGCDIMCCGRGYRTERQKVVERCRCKFHWCCTVECEQCEREIDVHTCTA